MSNISKKKKKDIIKLKKRNSKINYNNEENVSLENPQIKSTYQTLSSINNELDVLYYNIKYNKIFKDVFSYNKEYNTNNFPLLNKYFNYDKEDFKINNYKNKANIYLNNNNSNKNFIRSYENKLYKFYDNYKYNNCNKYDDTNNIPIKNNLRKRNTNYVQKENIKKSILNNFYNRKKKNISNGFFLNPKYNSQRNNTKYILGNPLEKNNNQKTKKLENINLYINNYKRKPMVYTQPDSIKLNRDLFSKRRNFSAEVKNI